MRADLDQASLFGSISPVTGEPSSHPPLCVCGGCAMPVEQFQGAPAIDFTALANSYTTASNESEDAN